MEYEITIERKNYLEARGHIILNACPGSGKTSSIVKKLKYIKDESSEIFTNYSGIACLSFTNAAKDELKEKYFNLHGEYLKYPHTFSTIDSFISKYITLPFCYLLNPDFYRPKIVEDDVIENAFKTVYRDRYGKWQEGIESPLFMFRDKESRILPRIYKPQDIWIERDGSFSHKGKKPSSLRVDTEVFQKYGKAIFHKKIKKRLITSLDSSFIAYCLLDKYRKIGEYLITRFPYIIIDEAQDNSEIQHAIFDKLKEYGLKYLELVGDPYQSLYEWRNAKPSLFTSKFNNSTWSGLPLSENRRSNQRIIDCFSILRNHADSSITAKDVKDLEIPIFVYKYNQNNKENIILDYHSKCEAYSLKSNHIVVRGNMLKNRMIGATVPIEPWHSNVPYAVLRIMNLFHLQDLKRAINELRWLSISLSYPDKSHVEKKELEEQYSFDNSYNSKLYSLIKSFPSTSLSFADWTKETQAILKSHLGFEFEPNFDIKKRMTGFTMKDLLNESIETYYNSNVVGKYKIPITTIHQVKGKTFDSILYFFAENSSGQNVSFKNFIKPQTFPTEKQRMIYVACSRPRQLLALAVPNKITDKAIKIKLGNEIEIIEK
jgi:superfamily I DNA/RNA helicase